jgi:8-oxo-dGTP pyrophosphatase MutT (NUDIX family)
MNIVNKQITRTPPGFGISRSDSQSWRADKEAAENPNVENTAMEQNHTHGQNQNQNYNRNQNYHHGQNQNHNDIRHKISLGIACCRLNAKSQPEILVVCKRYTYAYNIFAHSKYNSSNSAALIELFNCMTVDEKLIILSMRFDRIWDHVWLNAPKPPNYYLSKNKFESTFLLDNGARLRKLIAKSNNANKLWEIPKGRKKNRMEPDINCAVREFFEETGISKKSYKLFEAKRSYSYIDAGTRYTNIYYIAFTKHNIEPRINFGIQEQVDEISDIKWMTLEEIRFIDETGRLEKFIKPIFNFIKKRTKY